MRHWIVFVLTCVAVVSQGEALRSQIIKFSQIQTRLHAADTTSHLRSLAESNLSRKQASANGNLPWKALATLSVAFSPVTPFSAPGLRAPRTVGNPTLLSLHPLAYAGTTRHGRYIPEMSISDGEETIKKMTDNELVRPPSQAFGQRDTKDTQDEAAADIQLWTKNQIEVVRRTDTLKDYAYDLSKRGLNDEAAPLMKKAVEIRLEALGPEALPTVKAMNLYAITLSKLGREAEAAPLMKEVLKQRVKDPNLGPKDPITHRALKSYADALAGSGRSIEAEPLMKRALELRRKSLRPGNPDFTRNLKDYAALLGKLSRHAEAAPLIREEAMIKRETLGVRHPYTLMAISNYGTALNKLERHKEAEQLLKQVVALRREVLGPQNLYTLLALSEYGQTLVRLDRDAEALPFLKEAFELKRKTLGLKSKYTLLSLSDYAVALSRLGRDDEAEPLLKEALQLRRQVYGPKHPDTIKALNDYAFTLNKLGFEGVDVLKFALGLTRQVMGPKHPTTLRALNNYAFGLSKESRFAEAEPWFKLAVALRLQVNGPEDPTTLRALNNYAIILRKLGRLNPDLMSMAIDVEAELPSVGLDASAKIANKIWEKYGWNDFDSSWKMFPLDGLFTAGNKDAKPADAEDKQPETVTEQIWNSKGWNDFSGSWTFDDVFNGGENNNLINALFNFGKPTTAKDAERKADKDPEPAIERIWKEKGWNEFER